MFTIMDKTHGFLKILILPLFTMLLACSDGDESSARQVQNEDAQLVHESEMYFALPESIDEVYESNEFDFAVRSVV